MLKSSDVFIEKCVSEISKEDRAVEVYARVAEKKPFIIDDGTGRALVKGGCPFEEGDLILVIGKVSIEEGSIMPEIDPVVIANVNKFDLDLHKQLKNIKAKLT